jgi:hypothetical protein
MVTEKPDIVLPADSSPPSYLAFVEPDHPKIGNVRDTHGRQ